jgi:hypothetical protein
MARAHHRIPALRRAGGGTRAVSSSSRERSAEGARADASTSRNWPTDISTVSGQPVTTTAFVARALTLRNAPNLSATDAIDRTASIDCRSVRHRPARDARNRARPKHNTRSCDATGGVTDVLAVHHGVRRFRG